MTDEFETSPARQPIVGKSADEAIERLTDQLNYLVSVESVGGMVKTADLAAVLLQADRVAELEARVAELEGALAKANTPHWYYSDEEGSAWHSLEDALEQVTDNIWYLYHGDNMPKSHLVEIETSRPCPTIWGVVRLLTEDEAEARLTEEPWVFTPCATEAEARALLKEGEQ